MPRSRLHTLPVLGEAAVAEQISTGGEDVGSCNSNQRLKTRGTNNFAQWQSTPNLWGHLRRKGYQVMCVHGQAVIKSLRSRVVLNPEEACSHLVLEQAPSCSQTRGGRGKVAFGSSPRRVFSSFLIR